MLRKSRQIIDKYEKLMTQSGSANTHGEAEDPLNDFALCSVQVETRTSVNMSAKSTKIKGLLVN